MWAEAHLTDVLFESYVQILAARKCGSMSEQKYIDFDREIALQIIRYVNINPDDFDTNIAHAKMLFKAIRRCVLIGTNTLLHVPNSETTRYSFYVDTIGGKTKMIDFVYHYYDCFTKTIGRIVFKTESELLVMTLLDNYEYELFYHLLIALKKI